MEQTFPKHVDLPLLPWVKVYRKEPSAFIYDEHSRECTMFHFGIYRHSWFRQQCFAARSGCTWHREMADHARPQSPCSAGAGEEVSAFCTSLLWPCHFSLSAQVRCCCRREWQSYFLFPGSHRPVCSSYWSLFFTGSRSEEEGAEAHGPEDRPSAGRSSFFLLPWNCLQIVLKAFSSRQALLACCCNTPGIHDKLAENETDRARTAVHRPRTRWSRFWFWERIFSWTTHLITFVLRQATVGTLLCDRMILLFSKKPSKNEENYLLIETRDRKQKKINERSWSPFDCVTSRVTQQHSRRYFQPDLTMSCRESMLQLQFPATWGTRTAVPAICNDWTWRQNQSARNLNHFCRAPFRISGHFRWPITPLFFGIFLSFFHSMLSFHYLTSMHGKNLKVLCFKTAIWRTLRYPKNWNYALKLKIDTPKINWA